MGVVIYRALVGGLMLIAGAIGLCAAQATTPATPRDPVRAIVAAFADHAIVALGDGDHGNVQSHDLRLRLIRDPAFRAVARDIVVEFGNSRHQAVIDRYIRGETVRQDDLRRVWEDTAQANPVWDVPVYADFYRAVREVNATLPPDKRLRVILGDVPFDWDGVRTLADYRRQPQRDDAVTADIIRRQVLAKGRRALLIFGEMHLLRQPFARADTPDARPYSIVTLLEARGTRVFSIYTNALVDVAPLQPDIADWSAPALAMLAGTPLGAAPLSAFNPYAPGAPSDPARAVAMARQFDAMIYLGPQSSMRSSMPSPALCRDQPYLQRRFFRMTLLGMARMVDMARQYCAATGAPVAERG